MVDGTAQDRRQQSDIYAGMLVAAGQNPGQRLPTPGLVNRLAANGQQIPGAGLEDASKNNSKNLWSHCVMDSIVTPSQLIGPTEVSPTVVPDSDYDYSKYNPAADVFWDDSFSAQISGSGGAKCNTSFANLAIIGLRKRLVWWRPYAPTPGSHAVLGTRAWQITSEVSPMNGDAYTRSPTLLCTARRIVGSATSSTSMGMQTWKPTRAVIPPSHVAMPRSKWNCSTTRSGATTGSAATQRLARERAPARRTERPVVTRGSASSRTT